VILITFGELTVEFFNLSLLSYISKEHWRMIPFKFHSKQIQDTYNDQ